MCGYLYVIYLSIYFIFISNKKLLYVHLSTLYCEISMLIPARPVCTGGSHWDVFSDISADRERDPLIPDVRVDFSWLFPRDVERTELDDAV